MQGKALDVTLTQDKHTQYNDRNDRGVYYTCTTTMVKSSWGSVASTKVETAVFKCSSMASALVVGPEETAASRRSKPKSSSLAFLASMTPSLIKINNSPLTSS